MGCYASFRGPDCFEEFADSQDLDRPSEPVTTGVPSVLTEPPTTLQTLTASEIEVVQLSNHVVLLSISSKK